MEISKHLRTAIFIIATLAALPSFAQVSDKPENGKIYLINRNTNTSAYMYEAAGNKLAIGAASNTQKQYWRFVPTGKTDCFYIQNVTTNNYIQSSNIAPVDDSGLSVVTGTDPVEFEIKANTSSSFTGYYYMCSTDQSNIQTESDGSYGLNCGYENGVVAYHIRYNRGNSYWEFHETTYDYASASDVRSRYSRELGVYNLSCGTAGSAYLTTLRLEGDAVTDEIDYTAQSAPSLYYNLLRKDRATVTPGATANLSYTAKNMDGNYKVMAYFDWNGDGVFETMSSLGTGSTGSLNFTVPEDATLGDTHIRLRLTDNALEEAEDDVNGFIYEILATIANADASQRTLTICSCDNNRGKAMLVGLTGVVKEDGSTTLTADRGTTVTVEATPRGNASFKGWAIDGVTVSTESTYEFALTQSVTLTALFSPNTDLSTGISQTIARRSCSADQHPYNLAGQRINLEDYRGVYIQQGQKKVK